MITEQRIGIDMNPALCLPLAPCFAPICYPATNALYIFDIKSILSTFHLFSLLKIPAPSIHCFAKSTVFIAACKRFLLPIMSCFRTLFSSHRKPAIPIGSSHRTHQDPSFTASASKTIHLGPEALDDRIQIRAPNDNESPPAYSSRQASTDVILANIVQSNQIYMFDAKGAFNVLRHRTVHVHLDCNYALKPQTRKAIQLMAIYLLLIAKTFNCDMTFFFIGFPNKESPHFSKTIRPSSKICYRFGSPKVLQRPLCW